MSGRTFRRDTDERQAAETATALFHQHPLPPVFITNQQTVTGSRNDRLPAWQVLSAPLPKQRQNADLNGRQARWLARLADARLQGLVPDAPLNVQLRTLGLHLHLRNLPPDLLGVSVRLPGGLCLMANAVLSESTQETVWPQLLAQAIFLQRTDGHLACWRPPHFTGEVWARRKLTTTFAEAFMTLRAQRQGTDEPATRELSTISP